jgi:hypothetical protein
MTLVQYFDLYQFSDSGVDRGGSPQHAVVRVYESATGIFASPSAKIVDEWFGEGVQFDQILTVRHNLANDPIGGIPVHSYLDVDEYPFLYVVQKDVLAAYNNQPFRAQRVVKAPRSGVAEVTVVGLARLAPDERVEMRDGVLMAVSG